MGTPHAGPAAARAGAGRAARVTWYSDSPENIISAAFIVQRSPSPKSSSNSSCAGRRVGTSERGRACGLRKGGGDPSPRRGQERAARARGQAAAGPKHRGALRRARAGAATRPMGAPQRWRILLRTRQTGGGGTRPSGAAARGERRQQEATLVRPRDDVPRVGMHELFLGDIVRRSGPPRSHRVARVPVRPHLSRPR